MSWRLGAWWASVIGLAVWITLHFTILLLVQSPWPVLPPEAYRVVTTYVDPVFRQSWWLFAPNPPAFDRALYVRATYATADGQARGEATATPWLALSEPIVRAVQDDRLSLRDADLTVLLHGMYTLSDLAQLQASSAAKEELFAAWSDPAQQPTALVAVERAGSAALAASYPDLALRQVQVRLTLRRLPLYPDRADPVGEPDVDLVFPAVPFQDVAPWSPD